MSDEGHQNRLNHSPALPARSVDDAPLALAALRARTPARLIVGRSGPAYLTTTQLDLREDHAIAVDAVHAELDLTRDFGSQFIERTGLFEVSTSTTDKLQYLQQPELGRKLSEQARVVIREKCAANVDLQVAIGDGLSAAAIAAQVPQLLPLLELGAKQRGWTFGRPFAIRYCRVGVLNDIGELLAPKVVVLLIGERPGLAAADSQSAYMAYCPRSGHTDAQRNVISNIHSRGVDPVTAARRIFALAEQMRKQSASGVAIKEQLPQAALAPPAPKLDTS